MTFASLGLTDALVRAVADVGYTEPTPIQKQAIPAVLAGGDLLAGAQTGTGKTAGFVLPILQRLAATPVAGPRRIRALVLTPTRELAAQVEESVRVYGKYLPLKSGVIFGGVNINPQFEMLRRGIDLLVATPGRLLDHHGQRTIDLSHVQVLVLDEADRMLDMGFIHDIRRVLKVLPPQRQNLLFSATFSDEIRALADGLLKNPAHIQVTPRNTTVEAIAQKALPVDARRKTELLIHLVRDNSWYQVLVFTRTKHGANKLAAQLEKNGVPALPIHGNKSQAARTRALAQFKAGTLQVLVATDIAARGIDIDNLPHVVNFDIPHVPEDYVHRIGRTGRAGASGEALSLVAPEEASLMRDIERLIRRTIPREVVPGFEPGSAPINVPLDAKAGRELQPQRPGRPARRPDPRGPRPAHGSAPHGATRAAPHAQAGAAKAAAHAAAPPPSAAADRGARAHASNGAGTAPPREGRPHPSPRPAAPAAAKRATRDPARPARPLREEDRGVRSLLPPGWPGTGSRRR
jgi:ATP-dependent RNA helicase RhlE